MGLDQEDTLREILRLTKENNKMLHAARRNAWLGGIFKVVMWIGFIIIPLWLYMQYVAPVMQSMLESYQQLQGTSAQAQAQLGQMTEYLNKFQGLFGGGTP